MKLKGLFLKILINVLVVFVLFGALILVRNIYNDRFYVDYTSDVNSEITIESGAVYANGELQSGSGDNEYIFNNEDYYNYYQKTIKNVVDSSNDINVSGDAALYLRYLQTVPKIVCVYNDTKTFNINDINEINLLVNAVNTMLNLNIEVRPLSEFTTDTSSDALKGLLESGEAQLAIYTGYPFMNHENIVENTNVKMSKPFSLEKLYEVSLEDDSTISLATEKIVFTSDLKEFDFSEYNEENILVATTEEAIEMLKSGEVEHIVELNTANLDRYAEEGFYMSILDETALNGLNYMIATDEYAKELIHIIDAALSNQSIEEILSFGEEKYSYSTLYYLNKSLKDSNKNKLSDGYVDVAYLEHVGMIDNSEDEVIEGYSVDIMKYLSRALNIKFRLHNYNGSTYEEIQEALKNGEVDAILDATIPATFSADEDADILRTGPYLNTRFDIQMKVGNKTITALDDLAYKKMGTVSSDFTSIKEFLEYKLRNVGGTNLRVYSSYNELANALESGEIDYAVTYPGFTHYMRENDKLWSVDAYNENFFEGINSNIFYFELANTPEMKSILKDINRGISSTNEQDLTLKWFYIGSIYDNIVSEESEQSGLYVILLLVIIIIILSAIYSLLQQDRTETYLKNILLKDQKTGLGNRYAYNKAVEDTTRKLYCIKTRIPNYKFLSTSLPKDELKILMRVFTNRLLEFNADYKESECFYLENDEFVILIEADENLDITKYMESLLEILSVVYIIKDEQIEVKIQLVAVCNELIDYDNAKMLMYCSTILDANNNDEQNYSAILTAGRLQMLKRVELIDTLFNKDFEETITPYYRPIYSASQNTIVGLEVLGRIITGDAIISNTEYFDYALETGSIGTVQAILLEKMFIDRAMLIEKGLIDEKFAFSIYLSEVFLVNYLSYLSTLLDKYKIKDTSFMHIYLAESVIAKPYLTDKIKILQASDMRIVVDKFIVGHSSLGKIIELGVDVINIEHHVIEESTRNVDASLFEALIHMVKGMGLPICVSDIENKTDYDFVKSSGIEFLQGSYFLRALPMEIVEDYIRSGKYTGYDIL